MEGEEEKHMPSIKRYKTIRLEENLHRVAKGVAVNTGVPLQDLIEDLVLKGLSEMEGKVEL